MRITAIVCGLLLLFALPLLAEGASVMNPEGSARCEAAGTWFGGSQQFVPYQMTLTPTTAGRYSVIWELVIDPALTGYLRFTNWSGEMVRTGPGKYEAWAMSYWVWSPDFAAEMGVDGTLPELDIVHGYMEFSDNCDTIKNSIDVYNCYFAFDHTAGMTPFVTQADFIALTDGATIEEEYHRLPTDGFSSSSLTGSSKAVNRAIDGLRWGTKSLIKR